MDQREKTDPVLVSHLFPDLLNGLLVLLSSLDKEQWETPTACSPWTVIDVAHHLLGGDIGYLSWMRDGYAGFTDIRSFEDLVGLINQQNEHWYRTSSRFSPPLLREFLRYTGNLFIEYIQTLDPFEMSSPVEWTGMHPMPKWVDIAREYTERWHHQQHIRDAVAKPGYKEPRFLSPVLDTFMMALPQTFAGSEAEVGAQIQVNITGPSGRKWVLEKLPESWELRVGSSSSCLALVELDEDVAWRVFTRGIDLQKALSRTKIEGNLEFGQKVLETVSIIA